MKKTNKSNNRIRKDLYTQKNNRISVTCCFCTPLVIQRSKIYKTYLIQRYYKKKIKIYISLLLLLFIDSELNEFHNFVQVQLAAI